MRRSAVLLLCLGALAPRVRADDILLFSGKPLTGVRVKEETYEGVKYVIRGQEQTVPGERVKSVRYTQRTEPSYDLALEKMAAGDFGGAAPLFEAAAGDLSSWTAQYSLFNAAECLRAQRSFDQAIRAYEGLLQKIPKTKFYGECYLRIAQCQELLGNQAGARATYEKLKADSTQKGLGQRWPIMADYYLVRMDEKANPDKSFTAYEDLQERAAAADVPDVANLARLRLGYVLIEKGKLEEAQNYFQEIVDDRQASDVGTVAGAYNGLGNSILKRDNPGPEDYQEALWDFLKVVTQYGEELQGNEMLAEAMYWAGRCLEVRAENSEENQRRAHFLYSRVLKEFPSSPWARLASER